VDDLVRYIRLSEPAVLIEDTHPAPVRWPGDIDRVLLVRPTVFDYLRRLEQEDDGVRRFLVCDHPTSPTWPYGERETAELHGWGRWDCIGPIFRRYTHAGLERVRRKYRIRDNEQVVVFSMGGGGERAGSGDRAAFVHRAEVLAAEIQRTLPLPRLLFVRGPLFPRELSIPTGLEDIGEEPDLPSLLKLAAGAIIRPGFNLTWECIAAEAPFVPVLGQTFREPVSQRLDQIRRHGIDIGAPVASWLDADWKAAFTQACRVCGDLFSGNPSAAFLRAVCSRQERAPGADAWIRGPSARPQSVPEFRALREELREFRVSKHLLIRLDDVVDAGPAVRWFAAFCRDRKLYGSLEVIPYLSRLGGHELDRLDIDGWLEASQHGYAHLPQRGAGTSMKGEFLSETMASVAAARLLRRGSQVMRARFGERFRGGYSAPYDGLPHWLPTLWKTLGGRYVSYIWNPPLAGALPNVRLRLDPWDWRAGDQRPIGAIVSTALRAVREEGYAGIVLHTSLLADPAHRATVVGLIDALVEGGCESSLVSETSRAARGTPAGPVAQRTPPLTWRKP
jgi:hypothetical protein